MKEVKLVQLSDLAEGAIEFSSTTNKDLARYDKNAAKHRAVVEQRLASLLNQGWQIVGTSGDNMGWAYVILVRERQG